MSLSLNPGVLALLALAAGLYLRAVLVLARRGYRVPRTQQLWWWGGLALVAVGLVSPIDGLGEELLTAHMAQHLIITDLAAPLLLIGIRSPVYAFLLPRPMLVSLARRRALRQLFRRLRQPLVAIPAWVVILYSWHFTFAFEGALGNEGLHLLQHQSFMAGALLVWWSVIEPKRRRLPGDLWKAPYLLGARLPGMLLGMNFLIMRSPAYGDAYGDLSRDHGLSPLADQQIAGAMMMVVDLTVMLLALGFFFWRSGQEHDRAEHAARAAQLR